MNECINWPKAFFVVLFFTFLAYMPKVTIQAQSAKSLVRQGNQKYHENEYALAEIDYRKATEKKHPKTEPIAGYNLANSLYKQGRYEEAATQYDQIAKNGTDKMYQSNAFYNMGNALLKSKKLPEAIEAYKNALRRNPGHQEAKYNLAYAQKLKQEEDQQQEQQNQEDQQQEQQDQQQEQQSKEQQQEQQNEQDQQKQQEQQNSKEQQEQQSKEQQQQQQQREGEEEKEQKEAQQLTERKLSKEETERLLEALKNEELKVQQKLKQRQGKATKTKVDKDW
ncbi:MAG: tetratricopeptide repeat protein [Sphingobacteriales bacterium]|nr:MAG: tetratricopeptide repeat protein [Sphingobacteriales bacterium]